MTQKFGRLVAMVVGVGLWVLMVCALTGCDRGGESGAAAGGAASGGDGQLRVVASIPAMGWVAKGLSPEDAEVSVLLRPGASEHGFELTPSQVVELRDADVVLLAGFGLEGRVEAVLARHPRAGRRVIRLEDTVPAERRLAAAACCPVHGDGAHDHGHTHYTADPHAWLDPLLMADFVDAAGAVFAEVEPGDSDDGAEAVRRRIAALQAACMEVHQRYVMELAELPRRELVVMHNAYNYLAARYGLSVVAVIRPVETSEPTPADLANANSAIREHRVIAVFSEPQFPLGPARRLAELTGVTLETLDPIGGEDWPAMMLGNLEALKRGLSVE